MVQYSKLLRELSAMKKTLNQSMGYVRGSKHLKSEKQSEIPIRAPPTVECPETITGIPFCVFDEEWDEFDDSFQPDSHFEQSPNLLPEAAAQSPASPVVLDITSSPSVVLHRACQLFPKSKEIVEIALLSDPAAARLKIQIDAAEANGSTSKRASRHEKFSYAINIAVHHRSAVEVVRLLAATAPEVLGLPDGRDNQTTMAILLQRNGFSDVALVETLLQANPDCAHHVVDGRQNNALHIACSKGSSLGVIHCLYEAYPEAIINRNDFGETPLMIAQRCGSCPEEVLDYLQRRTWNHR